jgi:hypothetical protein
MSFIDAARQYASAGIATLPLGGDDGKRPLVKHPQKFGIKASLEIATKFPAANVGFWCGRRSNVTVVDIDSPQESELRWVLDMFGASPIIVRTGSGKHHVWYRHDGERRYIRPIPGHAIDILGGGLCVAPPSLRPAGGEYRFMRGGLANLGSLPKIRTGVLEKLEPAPIERLASSTSKNVVLIGLRSATLFKLALSWAHAAVSQAALLERLREANVELANPPLPDHEVQRAVGSAWKYKVEGRLMVPGADSSIVMPSASIARLLAAGEIDAMALLAMARRAHGSEPGKTFALSPLALERARKIGSWDKRRYRNATRRLCALGELVQVTQGGRGKHDPAMYRFAQPKEGNEFAPQS